MASDAEIDVVHHNTLSEAGSQLATVTIEILANTTLYEDLVGSTSYEDLWNMVV